MEEFFEGIMELVLDFVTDKFEHIQHPALRFTLQAVSIIVTCTLVLAIFFGIYWLFSR